MKDLPTLQRQYAAVDRLAKLITGSLHTLVTDYETEIDVRLGRNAQTLPIRPEDCHLCYGLKWSLITEPWRVADAAKQLARIMPELAEYVVPTEKPDGFAAIPDQDWDEYVRLLDEGLDLHAKAQKLRAVTMRHFNEKIAPYLQAREHHSD